MSFPSQPTSLARDHRGIPYITGVERFAGSEMVEGSVTAELPAVSYGDLNAKVEYSLALDLEQSCVQAEATFAITADQRGRGGITRVGGVARITGVNVLPVFEVDESALLPGSRDTFSAELVAEAIKQRAERLADMVTSNGTPSLPEGVAKFFDNTLGHTYIAFFANASASARNTWARFHYLPHKFPPEFLKTLIQFKQTLSTEDFYELTKTLAQ